MMPTVEYVESKIREFNDLVFGSCLPPVTVRLSHARSYLGRVQYRRQLSLFGRRPACTDFVMYISTEFDLPENEQEDVILHEMIHCYIAFKGMKDTSTHGQVFREWMCRINNEFGRNITVSHRMAPGTVSARMLEVRQHCICVSLLKDGKWGVTVCTEAKMPEIDRWLPRSYAIERKRWYRSQDIFFNRYPRSRTPKIYRISREDLDLHLADAQEL